MANKSDRKGRISGVSIFQSGQVVSAEGLINARERCPICLSSRERRSIMTVQEEPLVESLLCDNCKGASASFMPQKEILDGYYAQYYEDNASMMTFHNIERFANHLLEFISPDFSTDKVSILDFGGGDGSLSLTLAEKMLQIKSTIFIEILLIEYGRDQPSRPKSSSITLRVQDSLDKVSQPEKFDIIIASAVLEHIPDLNGTVKMLMAHAAHKAFFYARTPFISPLKRILRGIDACYPSHVHDLGASFWNRFVETFQAKAVVIRSQPSIVETELGKAFILTLISCVSKAVAYLELFLFRGKKDMIWNFYGGWEIFLRFE
jgi:2-polyprenyl-3-methyl-5-hydroxy-6-metoxy-1,4-benzoquinol methylase